MNNRTTYAILLFAVSFFLLPGCEKVEVSFGDSNLDDLDLVELNNLTVETGTLKLDSFITSNYETFMLGTQHDEVFGKTSAASFAEIQLPETNAVASKEVLFDSICIELLPTGNYRGDTTYPLTLSVHALSENIANSNGNDTYYNTKELSYNSQPLAVVNKTIRPGSAGKWHIRLSDALGQDWLSKLQSNDDVIQNNGRFRNYFKGFAILSDSTVNKNIFYFSSDSNNVLVRIYYKERGLFLESKTIEFSYEKTRQFNHLQQNFTGTVFSQFNATKKDYKPSTATGNRAYIHTNIPTYTRFSFPDIAKIKETFKNPKVIKAELQIRPLHGSFLYPYKLPRELALYTADSYNNITGSVYTSDGSTPQNGNLLYDYLLPSNAVYSFDITAFINSLLAEVQPTGMGLLMSATAAGFAQQSERLILNDQSINKDVKLKLYVLEL